MRMTRLALYGDEYVHPRTPRPACTTDKGRWTDTHAAAITRGGITSANIATQKSALNQERRAVVSTRALGIVSHASKYTLSKLYHKFTFLKFPFVSTTLVQSRSRAESYDGYGPASHWRAPSRAERRNFQKVSVPGPATFAADGPQSQFASFRGSGRR
ncbi:hypothetical protein ALC53_03698 [Atta colombica]|uniref:Uncharacterized protein n=1 Tax=Atta colombica TaxID=520822 RepID=A0A195BNK5_9HYME|nr:hypothetical protein ALC53_03698 [Atta colombica]